MGDDFGGAARAAVSPSLKLVVRMRRRELHDCARAPRAQEGHQPGGRARSQEALEAGGAGLEGDDVRHSRRRKEG